MPTTTTTTKEPQEQIPEFSLALSVELRATSRRIDQSAARTNPNANVVTGLPGIPLTRQVEFRIDLVPGAALVA
ncbi:hypothetical protein Tco_1534042 [Tanacetum coccineum]